MSRIFRHLNRPLPREWVAALTMAYLLLCLASIFVFSFAGRSLGASPSDLLWLMTAPLLFPILPMRHARTPASFLYALVQPVLVLAAWLTFHTFGGVAAAAVALASWLGIVPCLLLLTRFGAVPALLLVGVALAVTLPEQLLLSWRWYCVHGETVRVAEYVETRARAVGKWPGGLSGYTPQRAWALDYIRYGHSASQRGPQGHLAYHVGTRGTAHQYLFASGAWFYYPD